MPLLLDDYAIALMHDTGATAIAKFSKRGAANISTADAKIAATMDPLLPSEPMVSRESSSGVSSGGRSGATSAGGNKGVRNLDDSRASPETYIIREPASSAAGAWGSVGGSRGGEESQGGPALTGRLGRDNGTGGSAQGTLLFFVFAGMPTP